MCPCPSICPLVVCPTMCPPKQPCLPARPSTYQSNCPSTHKKNPSIHPPTHWSTQPAADPSTHPSVSPSIHPPIGPTSHPSTHVVLCTHLSTCIFYVSLRPPNSQPPSTQLPASLSVCPNLLGSGQNLFVERCQNLSSTTQHNKKQPT